VIVNREKRNMDVKIDKKYLKLPEKVNKELLESIRANGQLESDISYKKRFNN
jgi:hypothetical protein